jgi:hypothetical protein
MNIVNTRTFPPRTTKTTVGDLIGSNMRSHGHTAFVGSIGGEEGLFLITYECIVYAEAPNTTRNVPQCYITIDHYCDVVITEK